MGDWLDEFLNPHLLRRNPHLEEEHVCEGSDTEDEG
jgi:hypothetical protein